MTAEHENHGLDVRKAHVREKEIDEAFRHAMRRLATTVGLITTGRDDQRVGMAVTAVSSVCASPPTLLVVVNCSTTIHPVLVSEALFCVNLLADRHRELVGIFSGKKKGLDRFEFGRWTCDEGGVPVLEDAQTSLICRKTDAIPVGTHTIFLGEVQQIVNHDDISPLIWMDGDLASVVR